MEPRKPLTAVTVGDTLVVVCDDGSVWFTERVAENRDWVEHKPVPGTPAESEDRN